MSRLSGGLVKPLAKLSIANANENDHSVTDAEIAAFWAEMDAPVAQLVTV